MTVDHYIRLRCIDGLDVAGIVCFKQFRPVDANGIEGDPMQFQKLRQVLPALVSILVVRANESDIERRASVRIVFLDVLCPGKHRLAAAV